MRTIPAGILAAMAERRTSPKHLVHVSPGTTGAAEIYWTDAPFPIIYDGNTYAQQPFVRGDVVVDCEGNQAVELTFQDIDKVIRQLLYTQSWAYRPAVLYETYPVTPALSGSAATVTEVFIRADGRADGGLASLEDPTEPVTIAIVPDNDAEGATGPAQAYESSCRYVRAFKGIQCGYAGAETTCDGSRARCIELENEARHGGFPFAPKGGTVLRVGSGVVTVGSR